MTTSTKSPAVPATIAALLLGIAVAGSISRSERQPQVRVANSRSNATAESPKQEQSDRTQLLVEVATVQLQGIENGVLMCSLERGGFPEGNGLDVLRQLARPVRDEFGDVEPRWILEHTDPWGNPFHYQWPNRKSPAAKKPAIWSNGPNGVNENGGGDDIVNW